MTRMVKVKKIRLLEPIDVDKINIVKDKYFSNAYIVDLPLDSEPDHVWQDIFDREWMASRNLWDRKAFIIGNTLRLITTPEDMEEKISWVREVIAATNTGISTHYKQMDLRPEAKREAQRAKTKEEEIIERIRRTLRRVSLQE